MGKAEIAEVTERPPATLDAEREEFYESIDDEEDREYVRERTQMIRETFHTSVLEMGKRVLEVHDRLARYAVGTFTKWLELDYPGSPRSGYNCMDYAKAYQGNSTFAELADSQRFKQTALVVLSTADQSAIKEVAKIPPEEEVRLNRVREIVAKHKPPEKGAVKESIEAGDRVSTIFAGLNRQFHILVGMTAFVAGAIEEHVSKLDTAKAAEAKLVEETLEGLDKKCGAIRSWLDSDWQNLRNRISEAISAKFAETK